MMEIFHTIFTSNLFTSTFWQRKGDDNHVVAVAEKENEIKSEYILSLTECQYYPLCQAWLTLPPIVGPCMQCTSYINLYCAVLCWGKTILLPLFVCLISWDLSNFLFPFLRLSERFLQDLVMIAVLHITCNLGSVANCIFFSVETYKWPYEKLPKYTRMIVKRAPWCSHIFHELFKFPLLDTFLASCQPRAPLYSLSFIFFVGSLEFFCLIRTESAIFLLEKWHHWLILTVSDLCIPRQQSIFIFQKKQIQDQMSSSASSDEDQPETEPEVTFYIL